MKMTLKCFYAWVRSECKERRHTVTSSNIPPRHCCATGRLLRQRAHRLIRHITHTSHTQETIVSPKCKSNFQDREKKWTWTATFASRGTSCVHQLIDCCSETKSAAVWVSRPDDRDTRCLSAVPPTSPWNLTFSLPLTLHSLCCCSFWLVFFMLWVLTSASGAINPSWQS